jgi:hypothetical protein
MTQSWNEVAERQARGIEAIEGCDFFMSHVVSQS